MIGETQDVRRGSRKRNCDAAKRTDASLTSRRKGDPGNSANRLAGAVGDDDDLLRADSIWDTDVCREFAWTTGWIAGRAMPNPDG